MKNRIVVLILALLCGLAASYGVYYYIQKLEATYSSSNNFVPVAIAKQTIPARQVITEQMLIFTKIPSNYVSREVLGKPGDIVGKVSRSEIYQGEQILKSKLINPGDSNEGLSMIVENGRRAMTIAVNDVSGLAGMLKPGDRVDVLGTITLDNNNNITSTLVQDIRVLAVGKSIESINVDEKKPQNGTVTLSVNPFEAQHIAMAAENGSIQLLLRTPTDNVKLDLPSTSASHLIR